VKGKKSLLVVSIVCLVAALLISGCVPGAPPPPAPTAKPIKIGSLVDLTGPIADMGPRFKDGIILALETINYTVAGRPVEVIFEDGGSSPTTAMERFKKLHESDGVNIIIGPLMGDQQSAVAPYADQHKVLYVGYINSTTDCVADYGTFIAYPATCIGQQRPSGWFLYEDMGYRTMATLGSDYGGGHDYIAGAVYGFEEKGGKVVHQVWAPIGTPDFAPYMAAMPTKDTADVLCIFLSSGEDAARCLMAYRDEKVKRDLPPVFELIVDVFTPQQYKDLEDVVVGMYAQSTYLPLRDDPINNAFVAAFRAKYGETPVIQQNAYTDMMLFAQGLEITGGDDSFDAMWAAMTKREFQTPQGPLYYTSTGEGLSNCYIAQIQKVGDEILPVVVKTYERATKDPYVPSD